MQVIISARGCTISSTYRDALTRRLERFDRLLPKILEAKLVVSREKHRRTAALTVLAKHHTLRSEETAADLAAAVDLALAAMDRQVRDLKARTRERKPRRSPARAVAAPPAAAAAPPAASAAAEESDVRVRPVRAKPMSLDEAMAQFRLGREQFFVFTNAGTDTLNVLYRRRDGGLGLVEPVA
jgi:putative sigma-54 modulation protein